MSDNEDLLGDDLGDHSLTDYNLGNEEEEQLLADDYEVVPSRNVPASISNRYQDAVDMVPTEYTHNQYSNQQAQPYQSVDTECVVPNIIVEVPNSREPPTYAPYNEAIVYETSAVVPAAIPASPMELPQIVPSEMSAPIANGEIMEPRERFISSRARGQRTPQVRDIPDTLDKVFVPRGGYNRGRTSWRNPQLPRYSHPYRRNNVPRGNFNQRASFPPQQLRPKPPQMRPEIHHEIRPEIPPEIMPEPLLEIRPEVGSQIGPEIRPDVGPQIGPEIRPTPVRSPELRPPQIGPEMPPEQILPQDLPFRPPIENRPFPPNFQRFPNPQFRPSLEEPRPNFGPNIHPEFEPPVFQQPFGPTRPFYSNREISLYNVNHLPQVTIRQPLMGVPVNNVPKMEEFGPKVGLMRDQEMRMLPLPPIIAPGGLQGKKVLINPHFKGNFQRPEGPIKDIDDAAERFIAEQRNALANRAARKRRSPQRYIENTTIEIENDLAPPVTRENSDEDLLRRQEEFINANRAGLRRRMRSPTPPPRRSPSPPSPVPRRRPDSSRHPPNDEENEYKRRLREQESLRERVLRAKEVRRRKNAVLLQKQIQDRERERLDKLPPKPLEKDTDSKPTSTEQDNKPDTTRKTPEKDIQKETIHKEDSAEINSTCEALTPPHEPPQLSPERALTPPLPQKTDTPIKPAAGAVNKTGAGTTPTTKPSETTLKRYDSDDELDLILDDIDDILSDDDDTGRFKDRSKRVDSPKPQIDLRSKLPPKRNSPENKHPRQKIVFGDRDDKRKKELPSATTKAIVTSSTKAAVETKKPLTTKQETDKTLLKPRQRIIFDNKDKEKVKKPADKKLQPFVNRRVVIRKANKDKMTRIENDTSQPHVGIFSRAVRTAIGADNNRIVIKKYEEPQVDIEMSESDIDEDALLEDVGNTASVANLPHGMTDTRLKTLAGNEVQNLVLDKEDRSAKITFKNTAAAENFKKKFNNKMVAASRLTVTLQ